MSRRVLMRIGVFLLLGAMVNVAVAWGCAAWSPRTVRAWLPIGTEGWPDHYIDRIGVSGFGARDVQETVWRRDGDFLPQNRNLIPPIEDRVFHQAGFPMLALQARAEGGRLHGGVPVGSSIALPMSPMPAGFLWNTLLYAALAYLTTCLWEFRAIRRILKRRCAECGYDLRARDHHRCPECGAPVEHIGERAA